VMDHSDWLDARLAYDRLAAHYDQLTAGYDYGLWLARLLTLTRLAGPRVLDLACGTGKSCAPLLGHGYEISASDISPGMLSVARRRLGLGERRAFLADMRSLPECGEFDLITCLDDAVNYLRSDSELLAAFRGVARLLAPDGAFIFDTNTLRTYRSAFASTHTLVCGSERFDWRGVGRPDLTPGSHTSAVIEHVTASSVTELATHHQRHHPTAAVVGLLRAAGLSAEIVAGQSTGCRLDRHARELLHTKTVFVARRTPSPRPGR
jgi:SAM-dependent methyltransferase